MPCNVRRHPEPLTASTAMGSCLGGTPPARGINLVRESHRHVSAPRHAAAAIQAELALPLIAQISLVDSYYLAVSAMSPHRPICVHIFLFFCLDSCS